MDLTELETRFRLHALSANIETAPSHTALKKAAVLIPLIEQRGVLHIGLTQRPLHLRAHPGQISFPGGKVEKSDRDETHTALREAHEEIGLSPDNVEVLGRFPAHNTLTGFEITPVIGRIKSPFSPVLDPGEVADYFTVPLHFLRQEHNRHQIKFSRKGIEYPVLFIPYKDRFIWGATAAIIDLLCRHLEN